MKKIFLAILLLLPLASSAHVNGLTIERTEGQYFIDIGSTETTPRANKSTRFDFGLYLNPNKGQVDYDSVYVKIMKNGEFVFTATLPKQTLGTAGMTYTFPSSGNYDITALFQKDTSKVVETTFPLTVEPELKAATPAARFGNPAVTLPAGILLGIIIQFGISKFLTRKATT